MKKLSLVILALCFFHGLFAIASTTLDERYALRRTAAVVADAETATVYAEQLQTQLSDLVRANSRFEWSDEAFLFASDWLKRNPGQAVEKWQPLFDGLARLGAQSLVVAKLINRDDGYALSLQLLTTTPPQVMAHAEVPLKARPTLGNLNEGARAAFVELLRAIPFDATILRREGYRVILDRGRPSFREGLRLSAYTLENEDGVTGAPLQLVETGLIQITHVENNLAFGRIVVEWKPREVNSLNKIRSVSSPLASEKGPLFPQVEIPILDGGRAPAALASAAQAVASDAGPPSPIAGAASPIRATQAKLGTVSLDLTGHSLTMNRSDSLGNALHAQNSFFPGGKLAAEMYLTRTWFAGMSYGFGLGGWDDVSGQRLNGSFSQFRLQAGYRWNMLGSELGPSLRARVGYSTTHFGVDPTADTTAPTAAGYRGILIGGDFVFPFTNRFGIGLEGNALVLPSLSEGTAADGSALTSGSETTSVSAWDFALRAYYQLDPAFRLDARFLFQTYSAEFTGIGTAPASLSAMSTGGRALIVGVTYGF